MINIISLGAGKQSSYMLLNALEGEYIYKPDFAIFSDTGCEPQYVYQYLGWLTQHVKLKYNFDIIRVSAGNLRNDIIDYLNGKRSRVAMIPLHLSNDGFMNRQCTADYKIKPLRQYIQNIRNKQRVRLWIGISLDEMERMCDSPVKFMEHWYPLVENRITLDKIIAWYKSNNLPEPGKSACVICPFHSFGYWQLFKKQFPQEFEEACKFDDIIRNYPKLKNKAYLTRYKKPLREIDFSQHPSLFPELIEDCHGLCGL